MRSGYHNGSTAVCDFFIKLKTIHYVERQSGADSISCKVAVAVWSSVDESHLLFLGPNFGNET